MVVMDGHAVAADAAPEKKKGLSLVIARSLVCEPDPEPEKSGAEPKDRLLDRHVLSGGMSGVLKESIE